MPPGAEDATWSSGAVKVIWKFVPEIGGLQSGLCVCNWNDALSSACAFSRTKNGHRATIAIAMRLEPMGVRKNLTIRRAVIDLQQEERLPLLPPMRKQKTQSQSAVP